MGNTYTLTRKVLVREKELKMLKRHSLEISGHGHKAIYDSVDWRPITSNDLLVSILQDKIKPPDKNLRDFFNRYYAQYFYDTRYRYWEYRIQEGIVEITAGFDWQPFGWAILKKELPKVNAKKVFE